MVGRLTSNDVPATNRHGVPYLVLLNQERDASSRLTAKLQEALEAWLAADSAPNSSTKKKKLRKLALQLTQSALS